jgi:hypothetical protein
MTSTPCPSVADLLAHRDHPAIQEHLAECVRCRTLAAGAEPLEAGGGSDLEEGPQLAGTLIDQLEPGQVLAFSFGALEELLVAAVLDADAEEAVVAPVSDQPGLAAEWDMLLPPEVLGYPVMAEVWNYGHVLVEQAYELLATLATEQLGALDQLYEAALAGTEPPADAATGPVAAGPEDPRVRYQDQERERTGPFWQPAEFLHQAGTLGAFVHREREAHAVKTDEVEELVDRPGWLDELEHDRLDLERELPVPALRRLMDRLAVPMHEGTGALVRQAFERTCVDETAEGLVFARQRTGSRSGPRRPSREEARRRSKRYLDSLIEEMER